MLFDKNQEQIHDFDFDALWRRQRTPGISAFIRAHNEGRHFEACLKSIVDQVDEVIVAPHRCTDDTVAIAESHGCVVLPDYDFVIHPNGPGHDQQTRGSVHERAYFYNWALAHTTRLFILKWDGDMVAVDGIGPKLRQVSCGYPGASFKGVEIVRIDRDPESGLVARLSHEQPMTNAELRMWEFRPGTYYMTGPYCEVLANPLQPGQFWPFPDPLFLHFKFMKDDEAMAAAWPDDWRDIPHFQRIVARRGPGAVYDGPWPDAASSILADAGMIPVDAAIPLGRSRKKKKAKRAPRPYA